MPNVTYLGKFYGDTLVNDAPVAVLHHPDWPVGETRLLTDEEAAELTWAYDLDDPASDNPAKFKIDSPKKASTRSVPDAPAEGA